MNSENIFKYIEENGDSFAILNPRYKRKILEKKYNILLKKSNIPEFYWNVDFKHYKGENSKENLKKVIYYAQNFENEKFNHTHLYLFGSQSCQKTACGINILKEAIHRGKECYFVLGGILIDKLMKIQGYTINEEIESYINKLKNADMILLDDLFDEKKNLYWSKNSDLVITAWDMFLREVVSSSTKIIITSNIPIEAIKEKFGESLYHLIDRNFLALSFYDNIKNEKKRKYENLFNEIK